MNGKKGFPIVGITPRIDRDMHRLWIRDSFADSLRRVSLAPMMLSMDESEQYLDSICEACSGIVFSGGGDIFPEFYGESEEDNCKSIDSLRDSFELALFKRAFEAKIPILGICRGMQLITVALGGTLIRHKDGHDDGIVHFIRAEKDSLVYRVSGGHAKVNSYHHQSLGAVPSECRVTAFSDDGTAEAVEYTGPEFCVGVQWHPELMPEDTVSRRLFSEFSDACRCYADMY